MKIRLFNCFIALLTISFSVFSQNNIDNTTNNLKTQVLISGNENTSFNFDDYAKFKDTPSWNPEKGEKVPLTIQEAIEKGRDNLKQSISTEKNNWMIYEVNLAHVGNHKWIYIIEFYGFEEIYNSVNYKFLTIIKMNGTTFASKIKPLDQKNSILFFRNRINFVFWNDKNKYENIVKSEDLENTPSWDPEEKEALPLPLEKAVEIGRENINKFTSKANDKWKLTEISFNQLSKNKWIVGIDFDCISSKCELGSGFFQTYIKMNETVIDPVVSIE